MPGIAEIVEKAFLESVRTAVLVDDQFPTYATLVTICAEASASEAEARKPTEGKEKPTPVPDKPSPARRVEKLGNPVETSRASSLWTAFRKRGWNCDIDDGTGLATGVHRFGEADLTILDYELKLNDPEPALQLLKSLSVSDHASLAVVYTNQANLQEVRLKVAARLRGHRPYEENDSTKVIDDTLDTIDLQFDADLALQMLRSQTVMTSPFAKEVIKKSKALGKKAVDVVLREGEKFLKAEFGADSNNGILPQPFGIDNSASKEKPFWVLCNNLFVAFVVKQIPGDVGDTAEGERVVAELKKALEDWNPDGLTLTLSYSRGLIARSGFQAAANALDDPLKNACFLFFANSPNSDERIARVKQLYRRLLTEFAEKLLDGVAEFGASAIKQPSEKDRETQEGLAKWALAEARCDKQVLEMVHELNVFLSTKPPENVAQLGTVFRIGDGDGSELWMCASPACDMVPRPPSVDKWEGKLDPIRPVMCIRGERLTQLKAPLEDAEQGKAIFVTLTEDGRSYRGAIRFVPEKGTPVLEQLFFLDRGRVENGKIRALRLTKHADTLAMNEIVLAVVGQVRELYANRFLRSVGEQLSRIGVDFVGLATAKE